MSALRETPPAKLGDVTFQYVDDYERHESRSLPENIKEGDIPEPSGNLLMLYGYGAKPGEQYRIAVRPSGTEPKIKFYLFANAQVANPDYLHVVKSSVESTVEQMSAALDGWLDSVLSK